MPVLALIAATPFEPYITRAGVVIIIPVPAASKVNVALHNTTQHKHSTTQRKHTEHTVFA